MLHVCSRFARRVVLLPLLLVFAMFWPSFAVAQSSAAPAGTSGADVACLAFGAIIAVAVTFLKGVPFIGRNPKWVALICSLLVAGAQSWYHGALPSVAVLTSCVLTQLASAVATHEIAVKPVQNVVASPLA